MLIWVELSVPFLSAHQFLEWRKSKHASLAASTWIPERSFTNFLSLVWYTRHRSNSIQTQPKNRFVSRSWISQAFNVDTLVILWNHFNLLIHIQTPTLSASKDKEGSQSGYSHCIKLAKGSVVLGKSHTPSRCCLGSTGLSRTFLSRSHVPSCFIVASFDCLAVQAQVLRDWSCRLHDFHFAGGQKALFS